MELGIFSRFGRNHLEDPDIVHHFFIYDKTALVIIDAWFMYILYVIHPAASHQDFPQYFV